MIPETIRPDTDACELAHKWILNPILADRLVAMASRLEFGVQIISGWRSKEHQEQLIRKGKGAPVDRSTHTSCPATGADLWPTIAVTDVVKARMGESAYVVGLRWGGGSPVDPDTGIPSDWNHYDLGPRSP